MMELLFGRITFDWWMLAPVLGLGLIFVWLGAPDNGSSGDVGDPWGWRSDDSSSGDD